MSHMESAASCRTPQKALQIFCKMSFIKSKHLRSAELKKVTFETKLHRSVIVSIVCLFLNGLHLSEINFKHQNITIYRRKVNLT